MSVLRRVPDHGLFDVLLRWWHDDCAGGSIVAPVVGIFYHKGHKDFTKNPRWKALHGQLIRPCRERLEIFLKKPTFLKKINVFWKKKTVLS